MQDSTQDTAVTVGEGEAVVIIGSLLTSLLSIERHGVSTARSISNDYARRDRSA